MPRPCRADQFDPDEVCVCHVVQRCVRRAFLAGVDSQSGVDYSHRREWIRRRMEALVSVFGVEVLTYAVMSNHFHLILRNRPDVVARWSDDEVALRWLRVFPGRRLEEHLAEPSQQDVKTLAGNADRIAEVRRRLCDLSWFMRALSEPIARMANRQDDCTGRFWEGRFKAQRIVDEAGLLACSMYVDLNPVRAAMAEDPETSKHTGAYDRIRGRRGERIDSAAFDLKVVRREEAAKELCSTPVGELKRKRRKQRRSPTGRRVRRDGWLSELSLDPDKRSDDPQVHGEGLRVSDRGFLNLSWSDYKGLLRWLTRQSSEAGGKLSTGLSKTLGAVGIESSMFRDLVYNWQRYFGRTVCAGRSESMRDHAAATGRNHHRGQRLAAQCFASS